MVSKRELGIKSMEEISKDAELKKMQSQLSKFKLEAKLRRNLASEIEKQKQIALVTRRVVSGHTTSLKHCTS